MTQKRSAKRALLMSALSLLLCVSMLVGTTFAWFTDSVTSAGNIIQSGNLDIDVQYTLDGENWADLEGASDLFQKSLWEPGHTEVLVLKIENKGNLALKYLVNMNVINEVIGKNKDGGDIVLSEILTVSTLAQAANDIGEIALMLAYMGENRVAYETTTSFKDANILKENQSLLPNDAHYVFIKVDMAETVGNEANHDGIHAPSIEFGVNVLATQYTYENDSFGNQYDKDAEYDKNVDTWDGTTDISWYNDNDTEFVIKTAEELAGFAVLVDKGNTFAGKTIKLGNDIDLYAVDAEGDRILFDPIGDASNADFSGIFDGGNHTIYNLRQDCNSKHLGLFGAVYEGTVKNLTLDGALIENDGTGYASAIAAYTGASSFENITLKNTTVVNYNHNTGGIVGWCSNNGTTTTFDGINIEESVTIGSWWGSYDTRVGGIVGAMNTGNNVVIKNSTIACKLDVYNDVTSNYQWYNYRTAGMVVADVRDTEMIDGRTQAKPARVTCENVTVIFGDWANYHYCESASYGTPSYADPGEYKFHRVEAGLGYGGVDTSACNHAADETHNELIEFNFLFGARDGKGIYGISEFAGVTVIHK